MNIDIDIQVSGDDGEKLSTVSRHFSGNFGEDLNWGEGIDRRGNSFDVFLSEFLTSSGKIFRQALLYGSRSVHQKKQKSKKTGREETEVTYMIRFGNGQKVEGRIPILKSLSKRKESKKSRSSKSKKTKGLQFNGAEPQDFIDYFMQKAVERYESNFIHVGSMSEEREGIEG